jgi:hypothetical protein
MDEQTNPASEPVATLDPVVVNTSTIEPSLAEPTEAPAEAAITPAIPETAQTEVLSEPMAEGGTAQMGRNEPLTESAAEPVAEVPSAEAVAEAPVDTSTITSESPSVDSGSEDGMTMPVEIKAEEPRTPPTQQGTAQPEPTRTPEPPASPVPAQAPVIATPPPQNIVGLILTKARLMIQLRKQKKLLKIMPLFAKKNSITNDDVEKLLHVSDATATRYLSELEKQGKIRQSGKVGHAVTYLKI